MIQATIDQISAAFAEWERRYRDEPDRFLSEMERLGLTTVKYGQACAEYLAFLLDDAPAQ